MPDIVNELTVVNKLWNLACDPNNQPYIVRRNILPTLTNFLSHPDAQVSTRSAEVLKFLSSHPDNPDYICRDRKLLAALCATRDNQDAVPELRQTVEVVLQNLSPSLPDDIKKTLPQKEESQTDAARQKAVSSLGSQSRNIKLKVPNINADTATKLEEQLHNMQGVTSYTVEVFNETVTVYTKLPGTTLVSNLSGEFQNIEVIEESVVTKSSTKEDNQEPTYIPEQEEKSDYQRSLVAPGGNSLQARLEQQQKEREEERAQRTQQQSTMNRFFRKLTSALW